MRTLRPPAVPRNRAIVPGLVPVGTPVPGLVPVGTHLKGLVTVGTPVLTLIPRPTFFPYFRPVVRKALFRAFLDLRSMFE